MDYNDIYKEAYYYAEHYKELMDFFSSIADKGKLLDVGCGQGRNGIELSRYGYEVTGVDICKFGLKQIKDDAKMLNININLIHEDIYKYKSYNEFDFILLDNMVHFYNNEKDKETLLIEKIIKEMKSESCICICMPKQIQKENYLKNIFSKAVEKFEVLMDIYSYYGKIGSEMHLYAAKKQI